MDAARGAFTTKQKTPSGNVDPTQNRDGVDFLRRDSPGPKPDQWNPA